MSYMYNLLCVLFDSYAICKEISQKRELKMWLYVLSSISSWLTYSLTQRLNHWGKNLGILTVLIDKINLR